MLVVYDRYFNDVLSIKTLNVAGKFLFVKIHRMRSNQLLLEKNSNESDLSVDSDQDQIFGIQDFLWERNFRGGQNES